MKQRIVAYSESHDEAQEYLLSSVVHDLKNPLGVMMTALDLIEDDSRPVSDDERQDILMTARRACQQMSRMIGIWQGVHRLEAGQMSLYLAEMDPNVLIERAVMSARARLEETQPSIHLEDHIEPVLPIWTDADILGRILDILLEYASKYTPPGGSITLRSGVADGELTVSVDDTGTPVPAALRERFFDKLAQAHIQSNGRQGGLGLAFCKLAVEALGGRIEVQDGENQGNRIVFHLPLSAPEG